MNLRIVGASFLLLLDQGSHALAWDYQGHELIGSIADQLLGPNAKQQVADILGFELKVAAPWADCARNVKRNSDGTFKYSPNPKPEFEIPCKVFENDAEIARMEDYVSRNWNNCAYRAKHGCHETYHFTDVAIQHDGYSRSYVGTNDHDVVSAINAAIIVLKGEPAPPPLSIRDKKEALFLLAHFVGDLHEPLHVGAVYLDRNGQRENPDEVGLDITHETAEGNLIVDQAHNNFHTEWDSIPADQGKCASEDMLKKAQAVAPTTGAVETFAVVWASDTVMASHSVFADLTFSEKTADNLWVVQLPAAYWDSEDCLKRDQLAKGGARLAQLLNVIWPSIPP